MQTIETLAVVGGGPAASTLATLLAREGRNVVVFHKPTDRSITVGESLVPGVIPILQQLGVEEAVRSFSHLKPGAGFTLGSEIELEFPFDEIPGTVEDYAYNVPRNEFNETLRATARDAGVTFVEEFASLESEGDHVRLADSSLRATGGVLPSQPDLVVDATGRARLLASLLDLPDRTGPRTDTALFTHFNGVRGTATGTVHTDLLEYGWCWRIPLVGRDSFGVVMDSDHLDRFGETPEEQLETLRRENARVRELTDGAERLEPVYSFKNYQMVTRRLHGSNWVLVGDAAGFVDPVFSTGLYLGMDGARRLADALLEGTRNALKIYEDRTLKTYEIWMEIIERFYDGRLMTLLKTGQEVRDTWIGSLLNPHMEKHMGRIFTGRAAESSYGVWLLKFMCDYGLKDNDPELFRIKSLRSDSERTVPG